MPSRIALSTTMLLATTFAAACAAAQAAGERQPNIIHILAATHPEIAAPLEKLMADSRTESADFPLNRTRGNP
ncbi:MAG: hypothetical protein WD941_07050 [Opitutus sp.]